MKYNLLVFILLLSVFAAKALDFSTNISKVTVYQQGAQVSHVAKVSVNAGISKLSLRGLTQFLDINSIQVKLTDAKIVSLNYWVDYLSDGEQNKLKNSLLDSLDKVNYLLESEKNNKKVYEQELKLIENNVQIKGQAVLDVVDMDDFLAFYRSNLPVIHSKMLDSDLKIKAHQNTLNRIQQALNNINANPNNVCGVLDLEVSTAGKSVQDLSLSYFVNNAGWEPYYNMRASTVDLPIEMEYNANVYQSTGVDWKGVELTLATGSPKLDNNIPVLNPWWLNFYHNTHQRFQKKEMGMEAVPGMMMDKHISVSSNLVAPVSMVENLTFFEFKIPTPYNINADGLRQRVEICKHELKADFSYFTLPKINNNAYLVAKVTGWDEYKMLSGNSKIYFEGTYVGEAYIDVQSTNDTLHLSLGQDKNIVVERELLKNKSSKNTLGAKKEVKQAVEIRIRNNKNNAVKIRVLDQYPVSQNGEIKVKLGVVSNATTDADKGELEWKLELPSKGNAQLNFDFEVSFPKNENINL